ncbi:hypothetical protein ANCDUO_16521, partial [Ancylostoma duodenale]
YVHEALLQASLQSFATKHPAFGETVQIVKKTPIAAFRRVLQLIVRHNWTARPLFVDFDGAWNEEEVAKLESNFVKMRPVLPPMVIITNEDPVGSRWTRDGPTPLLLKRIVALAKSVLKVLDMNYENEKAVDIKSALLSVDMSIYDAVIEIFPKMVVRTGVSEKTPLVKDPEALPVVNFDPVDELVYALNAHFQNVALFFWNRYGGDHIGVIWKPYELEVPAKISRCSTHYASKTGASSLLLNKDEVLEGIRILGEHPRFSKFKNAGRAAEQQAKRREDAMERQRNSRFDHFNHTRKLAENEEDDEEIIDAERDHREEQEKPQDLRKKRYKS